MSRAWFALAVIAVLGLFYVGAELRSGPVDGVASGQEQPAAAAPGNEEEELRRLMEVRFNAASAVFARTLELFERGSANSSIEYVCSSFERFVTASVELAKSPAERVKALESALVTAKQIDEKVHAIIDRQRLEGKGAARVPVLAREQTKYVVAQIGIDLIRARRAANFRGGK